MGSGASKKAAPQKAKSVVIKVQSVAAVKQLHDRHSKTNATSDGKVLTVIFSI